MTLDGHTGKLGKRAILMLICCLVPIVGIVILAASGIIGSWGYYGLILLCPLGHLVIMFLINQSSESHQGYESEETDQKSGRRSV